MTGKPSHFEIGVPDLDRAQRFYGELLGWRFEGTDNGARIETDGLPGGLHRQLDGVDLQIFYVVADLGEAAKRIVELGGEVDERGEEEPGGHWLFSCRDDQGVPFGLHQPSAVEE